jgi:hypothetical protein
MKIWSELPRAQAKEVVADVATVAWVGLWGYVGWRLYTFVAQFAEAGRAVRAGGENIGDAGVQLRDAVRGAPIFGEQLGDAAKGAFAAAGAPFVDVGDQLESFILVLAAILGIIFVAVLVVPWLMRYVPWRWERLMRVRAAHRAIRRAPEVGEMQVERLLASRAVHRLPWDTLLEYSPDPIGDWATGRHDRLARAELAEAGLRLR